MDNNLKPIKIVFEEDMPAERVAEFIDLLSALYGEELDLVSFHDIPPLPRLKDVG
ncbi:hypothetical protein [Teredinibacter turnerae]|uniref:hypothetical protein n=1 Tax=Teredinibacter turnerae TaxID=2426 RepID=UPI000ACD16D6|nr:hypothetical protein [Teredinibacter turnerae]